MIIEKGEREYAVTELPREWKVERTLGGVAVEYKIPKEPRRTRQRLRGISRKAKSFEE